MDKPKTASLQGNYSPKKQLRTNWTAPDGQSPNPAWTSKRRHIKGTYRRIAAETEQELHKRIAKQRADRLKQTGQVRGED
jgi:hypothetical protein